MPTIESIRQLESWLISKGINITQWGIGAAKSVQNLWNEIASGEAQLQDNPPQRVVHLVEVIIHSGNRVLVEDKQRLSDDRVRSRNLPLSEKMKPGESPVEAAMRGLEEEMQVKLADVKVLNAVRQEKPIYRESQSYPGLRTKYQIYKIDVEVNRLPGEDFWTNESQGNHESATKQHHWHWVDKDR